MRDGWQTATLGSMCDILDHQRRPITKRARVSGDYPYYGATGIVDFVGSYIFDEPLVLIGEDGAKWEAGENSAFKVDGRCWVNNHAHVIRTHRNRLLDSWAVYYLNHADLIPFVSGLTVPKLNQGALRKIPLPLPPLDEQQRIVRILDQAFDAIATAKANAERNLANAKALFERYIETVFRPGREGWKDVRLGDLTTLRNGINFTKSAKGETVRIVGVKDFQSNYWAPVESLESVVIDGTLPDLDLLRENDILFVRSNGNLNLIGRCLLVGHFEGRVTHSGFTIRARLDPGVQPRYVCHYLKSQTARNKMIGGGIGTNIKSLN